MADCSGLITNQDLENAKQNADTYKVVIESDLPTTTTPDGKTIFTLVGLNQQISFIYPPILWQPGLVVDNALQLYEVPPSASGDTGSFLVFPFVENLPFTTGPTYDPGKWTVLQYSKEILDQAIADATAQADRAEQEADDAEQSAIDAAQSASDAQQSALDAAQNGNIYLTVADGIADTVDGDLFVVVSSQFGGFVDLYLNDSGIGVYQGRTNIDLTFLQNQQVINNDYFSVLGRYTDFRGSGDIVPIVIDDDGVCLFWYDKTQFKFFSIEVEFQSSQSLPIKSFNHVLSYGQSLSVGSRGIPAISLTQPFSNLTFQGGPRAADNTSYLPLKALTEDDLPGGNTTDPGETTCSGCLNYTSTLIAQQEGVDPNSVVFIGSAPGRGGVSITRLIPSDPWYNDVFVEHITQGYNNNNDYAVHAVTWKQGETDGSDNMDYSTYYGLLQGLQVDVTNTSKAITGENHNVPFINYQMSSNITNNDGQVCRALFNIAKENVGDFFFSTPLYHLPYADNLHLTNVGYKILGCYEGRVYKEVLYSGSSKIPVVPISATYSGTTIDVKFDVRYPPLQIDTTDLAVTTDDGFVVTDGGSPVTISSISIAGEDTVRIELNSATSGSVVVRYALDNRGSGLIMFEGASGNIRDSNDDIVNIGGTDYTLFNVCPHFQLDAYEVAL